MSAFDIRDSAFDIRYSLFGSGRSGSMTGRERILAAMSQRGSASTPIVLCYPEIFMRECWEKVTAVPWWGMFSQDIEMAVQAHRDMLAVTGEDRVRIWMSARRKERDRYRIEGIDAGRARRIDTETGKVEELLRPPPGGFVSAYDQLLNENKVLDSRRQIDEALPLPPRESAESLAADGRLDKPRRMLAEFAAEKMPWTQLPSPITPLLHVWGFEGLMVACADRPDLVEYACRRVVQCNRLRIAAWRAAGAELIWLEEGYSDLISPRLYERLLLPSLQEMTAALREAGMKSIHYYTGDPNDRLELLLASGADALALECSRKAFTVEIEDLARRVDGRIALLGNLDEVQVLEKGPVSAIRAEVERQLAAGRANGGRFIMGIAGPITPGTPLDHVRAIAETVHEFAP
jgi:hypothetical protein